MLELFIINNILDLKMSQNEGLKYGIYDPVTKMFYTVPVSTRDEFNRFLLGMGLVQNNSLGLNSHE